MAALWFGVDERATANMLASVSSPIGTALASVVSPLLAHHASDIPTMHWVFAIPALAAYVLTLLFVRDKPPTPPSISASEELDGFWVGMHTPQVIRATQAMLISFNFEMKKRIK